MTQHDPESDPQAHDLPLDAHLHTTLSSDSDVPIDAYAAAAVERRIAELAITDHIDFDPRWPNYQPDIAERERIVRATADRWAPLGIAIRFGLEVSYESARADEIREHLAGHPYDFVIGSVHVGRESPYHVSRVDHWVAGKTIDEIVAPYFDEVESAARRTLRPGSTSMSRSSGRSSSRAPVWRSTRADCARRRARRTRVRPSSPGTASSAAVG